MFRCWNNSKKGNYKVEQVKEDICNQTFSIINYPEVVKKDITIEYNNDQEPIEGVDVNNTLNLQTETIKRRSRVIKHISKVQEHVIKKYPKEESDELLITQAITSNELLQRLLDIDNLQAVVDAMFSREVKENEIIISEGSVGTELYVSATGIYEILIQGKSINIFSDNRVFGELAILYDAKRQATVKVIRSGKLWVLDQKVYQQLMLQNKTEHHNQIMSFLRKVPKLNTVSQQALEKVSELLQKEIFNAGDVIIHEGESGEKFYIISKGIVIISKKHEGEIGKRSEGEYFGELALLTEDNLRQATVTANTAVECFSLSCQGFIDHFGSIQDIESVPDLQSKRLTPPTIKPYQHIQLQDLKEIETLGVGSFGRVQLVLNKNNKLESFALKKLKKINVVLQQQQEDVYNEKNVQIHCNNNFILQMYKTFKDQYYIYFLLEVCLGGDLYSLLQRQKHHRFEAEAAKFYAASVLEAFDYLRKHKIIYRDLKPENLLLSSHGYLKLIDFGFAKVLDSTAKTYTFAGTPEYVAPEIILFKGHNHAIHYWQLGILIFEMLVGKTPFYTKDPTHMDTYNLILRGIEDARFPENISRQAKHLIKRLCRAIPTERLGYQKEESQAVRKHAWFTDFDWNQLREGVLKAPFIPTLKNNVDIRYFDKFTEETDIPPSENSGWDKDL